MLCDSSSLSLGKLLICNQNCILVVIFGLQLAFLILRAQSSHLQTHASVAADGLSLAATFGAIGLSIVNSQRSYRPSTLLSLYVATTLILGIVRVRTLWLISPTASAPGLMTAIVGVNFIYIVRDTAENRSHMASHQKGLTASPKQQYAPEQFAGLWKRTAFSWLLVVLRMGSSKILTIEDLPSLDTKLRSSVLRKQFISSWSTGV